MSIFKDKENYLQDICAWHPDVRHGIDGRKSFFRFNQEEELAAATVSGIAYPCVGFMRVDGRITDRDNAMVDIRHVFKNGWVFLDTISRMVDTDGIGTADKIQDVYDRMFELMEDFIKYMKDDFDANGKCAGFYNFDLNKINYTPIGPTNQDEYGWMMYFDDEYPAERIIG